MSGISAILAIGGAWSPLKLGAPLIGWWKGDVGVFSDAGITPATDGGNVQQWNDQSGNGNNLVEAVLADKPTYHINQLNSLPAIGFDPTANIQALATASLSFGASTVSIFAVAKGVSPASNSRLFIFQASGQNSDFDNTASGLLLFYPGTTTIQALRNNSSLSQGTISDNAYQQLGSIFDGANHTAYVGGAAQTPVASAGSFGATGFFQVGAGIAFGLAGGAKCFVTEMILTNTALGAADQAHIQNYFSVRYGV